MAMKRLSAQDKHNDYIEWIKWKITKLNKQRDAIDKEIAELEQKLQDNENYIPEKELRFPEAES